MVGLDHGRHSAKPHEPPEEAARNSRYGLVLFTIYLLLYGTYVLVNAFSPEAMEQMPFAGVPWSILSGFGLILAAFLLALVYGWLCRRPPESRNDKDFPS